MRGIFISHPYAGRIFVAERSRKGSRKLLWSVMLEHHGADVRCLPNDVPRTIRRAGYRFLSNETCEG